MANILLIEDDIIVQHVHKLMLKKLGHQVVVADSGYSALVILKEKDHFEAIFVDLGLPDINGKDLIKEIRGIDSQIPIIAITGYTTESDKKICLEAGANSVMHKPVIASQMVEVLGQYLKNT